MVSDPSGGEVILDFPVPCPPVRHMRSTLIVGSIAAIRAAGHFGAYEAALEPVHRDALIHSVAGIWIPIDVTRAHYRACDSLGLSPEAAATLGRSTFDRTGGTMFGTILRLAKGAGVTPWTLLPQLQRFWDRGNDGGGIRAVKLGPKEARLELIQCPLCEHPYYRHALRGLLQGVLELFCKRAYMQELPPPRRAKDSVAHRAQWA
jgi:hypothetical protein